MSRMSKAGAAGTSRRRRMVYSSVEEILRLSSILIKSAWDS
jgi:hypothetical protein